MPRIAWVQQLLGFIDIQHIYYIYVLMRFKEGLDRVACKGPKLELVLIRRAGHFMHEYQGVTNGYRVKETGLRA